MQNWTYSQQMFFELANYTGDFELSKWIVDNDLGYAFGGKTVEWVIILALWQYWHDTGSFKFPIAKWNALYRQLNWFEIMKNKKIHLHGDIHG